MHHQHLFQILKDKLYSDSTDCMATKYEEAMNDNIVKMHQRLKQHLQTVYARQEKWTQSCWVDIPMRGNNTDNYCESVMNLSRQYVSVAVTAVIAFIFS